MKMDDPMMEVTENIPEILELLDDLQQQRELSIIKLSEPFYDQQDHHAPTREQDVKRGSDASSSADASSKPTPASLEADLLHYKDLFTKLRFSYVEQVTKEKFLRAVVGDPPLYVTAAENANLEAQLLEAKVSLKHRKEEVAVMIAELERRGRDLAQRWQEVQLQTQQLRELPSEIEELRATVTALREEYGDNEDRAQKLPLPATRTELAQREVELDALNRQIDEAQGEGERKESELRRLEEELKRLEAQKTTVTTAAREAMKRKEQGSSGLSDELEAQGRWLSGVEASLRSLLEVEG